MTLSALGGPAVWGATYIPSRAYNAYLQWRDFDAQVITRDLGFAAKLRLNAIRVFVSFDAWLEDPGRLQGNFDHFLALAAAKRMRTFPVLFDHRGLPPTSQTLRNRDPLTASRTRSPHPDEVGDATGQIACGHYVDWFTRRYGDDPRVLAIDVAFGSHTPDEVRFTREMFRIAEQRRGSRPLTIGTETLEQTRFFMDLRPDVVQVSYNYPRTREDLSAALHEAAEMQNILRRPVWLAEWQRIRPTAAVPNQPLPADDSQPAYATMADDVRRTGLAGAFFASLMINPAPDLPERTAGVLTGLFQDDGAVWSLQDARAISNDLHLFTVERREWPDFAKPARQAYLDHGGR